MPMSNLSYCPLPPRDQDIYRFRSRYSINLGPIFLHGPTSPDTPNTSELETLQTTIKTTTLDTTTQKYQTHWQTCPPSTTTLLHLRDTLHYNTLHLPLSFLTLGPLFSQGTPFEGGPAQVYTRCWSAVKHFIERCHTVGIGVLLDFDLAANGVDLGASAERRALARDCVAFVVQEVRFHALGGVVGVRVSRSSEGDAGEQRRAGEMASSGLGDWEREVRMIVRAIDEFLPLHINCTSSSNSSSSGSGGTPEQWFRHCSETPLQRLEQLQIHNPDHSAPSFLLLSPDEIRTKAQQARIERPQLLREILMRAEAAEAQAASKKPKLWNSPAGRQSFVHGWDVGFSDALRFFDAAVERLLPARRTGADKIGEVDLWARRRTRDVERLEEDCRAWELGLRRGIADFDRFVGN
ncbi:uncharacterized protein BP01DRAFT_393581 [Aspergillus saccharolyticus JOP 1030-1]|uniref:Uncharacterized protein n=1 Tax=Aspergillus saccharolyticus JOP 1030-1 TaxID=1450539 RepID=A0A318ZF19_9EURO|nr:hypothetical protein BP01DRAFT_393581 [Aspergillus saccharolyticus JOP 1030-1]PYH43233.1 hypothetical protein BP01DRAFT_393581 [Aspergillus saccharolyticus JOP 1030-1]